jgi:hypothetical protein
MGYRLFIRTVGIAMGLTFAMSSAMAKKGFTSRFFKTHGRVESYRPELPDSSGERSQHPAVTTIRLQPLTPSEASAAAHAMGVSQADTHLAQGNPGAIRVLSEVGSEGARLLEQHGIRGSDIWLLYKDVNGENAGKTLESLRDGTAVAKLKANQWSSFHGK